MATASITGAVRLETSTTSIVDKNSCNETISLDIEPNVSSTAKPISPPQKAKMSGFSTCLVEYDYKPYSITWKWMGSYPDLTKFPPGNDVLVSPEPQSPEMAAIWRGSDLLNFGAYASVRKTKQNTEPALFPILKLSHPDQESIELIQYEFKMLTHFATLGLPIPKFDPHPVMDGTVICGYRMKELFKIDLSDVRSRSEDIKDTLRRVHSTGICHGDISYSNIMKDNEQNFVLIDWSFAGRLGTPVPPAIPAWAHPDGIFSARTDLEALEKRALHLYQ